MTDLRVAMNDYLTVRRQLGFQLRETGRLLDDYVTVSERAGEEHLTTELAVRWARSVQAHPNRWQRRLGVIRGFARYLSTIDPQTEIPSEDLLRGALPRVAPYLYSPAEITALMSAARELTGPLRSATFETIIGLLAVSGLRAGEVLGLDRGDVDLHDGALHVRAGKQAKQCEVPLHDTTTQALLEYGRLRDHSVTAPQSPAFLPLARRHTGDRRCVQRDVPRADRTGRVGGTRSASTPAPARLQTLGGRRGYAPCRTVLAGNGAVGG